MTEVAKLPVKCGRLVLLNESTMAVCGQRVVYFRSIKTSEKSSSSSLTSSVVEISLPRRAECFAPWLPVGASLQQCGVFYIETDRIYLSRCVGDERLREVMRLPSNFGKVGEMMVFFNTTLVVRGRNELLCYALNPIDEVERREQPSLIGRISLPFSQASAEDAEAVFLMDGFSSCTAAVAGDVNYPLLTVVVYSGSTQRVGALLLTVDPARVTVQRQTPDDGILLTHDVDESLRCWSVNWCRREVLFVFGSSADNTTTTKIMSLDAMEWAVSSVDMGQLPSASFADVGYTHTGDLWAVDNSCDGVVKFMKLSMDCVTREVELPQAAGGDIFLTTLGNSLFVLMGRTVIEVQADNDRSGTSAKTAMCDWLMLQASSETCEGWQQGQRTNEQDKDMQEEIDEVVAFVKHTACNHLTMIVRDCRYVSSAPDIAGAYRHAVLDTIHMANDEDRSGDYLLRYIAVAQSLHPVTILQVLNVRDPSIRLSLAVLLAAKPPLVAGGVRLLEWSSPARAFCRMLGQMETKQFIAGLYNSALTALAAGALGAVGLLCVVADIMMVATLVSDKHGVVSLEEAAAEVAIAEAIGVLSSYAQWALNAASTLGTMTAHVGPVCNGKKEAAVRERVAHAIITSRNVQIEPLTQLGKRQVS